MPGHLESVSCLSCGICMFFQVFVCAAFFFLLLYVDCDKHKERNYLF